MYRGKRVERNRKAGALLASLMLILGVSVAGAVAFLVDSSGPVVNTFTPTEVPPEIVEKLEGEVKKEVTIKNSGNIDAYIRATVVVNWLDKDGNILGEQPVYGTDYTYTLPENGDWFKGDDGFYYYTKPVVPGNTTAALLTDGKVLKVKEDCKLSMEILAQSIQSVPTTTVESVWDVTVDDDGNLTANKEVLT